MQICTPESQQFVAQLPGIPDWVKSVSISVVIAAVINLLWHTTNFETPAGSDTPTQSNHKSICISSESRLWFPTTRGLRFSFTQAEAANNQSIIPSTIEFSHRSRLEGCETLHPRVTHEQQKRKFCRKPYKNDERTADRRLYLILVAANNVLTLEYRIEKLMHALSVIFSHCCYWYYRWMHKYNLKSTTKGLVRGQSTSSVAQYHHLTL